MDYDADRDILVASYPAVPRTGEGDTSPAQYFFGRYDNWSKGQRVPRWKQRALEPQLNPDFFMYEKNLFPYRGYMGLQIAGDYVFFAYLFGEVHVFELATGKLVEILALGPEVNGQSAWEDAAMGLRLSAEERRVPDLHRKQRLGRQEQLLPLAAVIEWVRCDAGDRGRLAAARQRSEPDGLACRIRLERFPGDVTYAECCQRLIRQLCQQDLAKPTIGPCVVTRICPVYRPPRK